MTPKSFTVMAASQHVTAIRYDKKSPRVKIAATARKWRGTQ